MSEEKKYAPSETQAQIINSNHPRILVVATAGSGKTQTLVERYKRLVADSIENKDKIIICSFTNKAVEEIGRRLKPEEKTDQITTFHKFCNSVLSMAQLGNKAIANPSAIVLRAIHNVEHETKIPSSIKPDEILRATNLVMNHIPWHTNDDMSMRENEVYEFLKRHNYKPEAMYPFVKEYFSLLDSEKIIDYNSILQLALWAIKDNINGCADKVKKKYNHCFFDEAQDFSIIQWHIVFELEKLGISLFLVGDDAQCIYKFRGAEPSTFKKVYENETWQKFLLNVNYRSHSEIVQSSDKLFEVDFSGIKKSSKSQKGDGGIVYTIPHLLGHLIAWSKEFTTKGSTKTGAIIVRTNKVREIVETTLDIAGVNYHTLQRDTYQGVPPKWTEPLYPLISWLEVILEDNNIESFGGAFNCPMRMDIKRLKELEKKIKDKGIKTVSDALSKLESSFDSEIYIPFGNEWRYFRELLDSDMSGPDFINNLLHKEILDKPGRGTIYSSCEYYANPMRKKSKNEKDIADYYEAEKLPEVSVSSLVDIGHMRTLEVLGEKSTNTSLRDYLKCFLKVITRQSAEGTDSRLFVSTVHQAKGLEFDEVYLPYFQDSIVPLRFENITIGTGPDLNEERRIAYVALTRARQLCFISHEEGQPSPFINEIFGDDW